jgi:hypothetical protein
MSKKGNYKEKAKGFLFSEKPSSANKKDMVIIYIFQTLSSSRRESIGANFSVKPKKGLFLVKL